MNEWLALSIALVFNNARLHPLLVR